MKNKFASILLACSLVVMCLAGCSKEDSSAKEEKTSTESSVEESEAEESETKESEAEESKTEESKVEESKTEESASAESTGDLMGSVENNTYYNNVLDLQCTFPDSWAYLSSEEIEQVSGVSLGGATAEEAVASGQNVTILYAHTESGANINVAVNNSGYLFEQYTTDELYDQMEATLAAQFEAVYEQLGYSDCNIAQGTATFLGETVPCLDITATYLTGDNTWQKQLFIPRASYAVIITVTEFNEADAQAVLDCISVYEE